MARRNILYLPRIAILYYKRRFRIVFYVPCSYLMLRRAHISVTRVLIGGARRAFSRARGASLTTAYRSLYRVNDAATWRKSARTTWRAFRASACSFAALYRFAVTCQRRVSNARERANGAARRSLRAVQQPRNAPRAAHRALDIYRYQ